MTIPLDLDLDQLGRRYMAQQMRFAALQGQSRELHAQQSELAKGISLALARIEMAPEVKEAFEFMQEKAHARAVGDFEDLLSAFVSDVIPEAGTIVLTPGMERGAPSLEIELDNDGNMENILKGNGGGLTNVVVTGLIYAAQARTNTRPLVLLDEPDCWVKAPRVPAFTKVIADVANPRVLEDGTQIPGCQTLMISHNDLSLMAPGAHIQNVEVEQDLADFALRMGVKVHYKGAPAERSHIVWVPGTGSAAPRIEVRYREDSLKLELEAGADDDEPQQRGFPYIESLDGARAWDNDAQVGIRWVEVENLMRHIKTRINLSSGLNVLSGDINSGKSTLFGTAFCAMAYGESDDTMIRHGADAAVVRMGLENDVVLEMVRNRKGSPKVLFRRYNTAAQFEASTPANEACPETRGHVPEFITAVLRIERVDDLDIQLRSQKSPVFLLNETGARRARLLSVGRESGLLHAMIEKHRLALRRDRDQVKRDEVEINKVNCKLRALSPLAGIAALVDIMTALQQDAQDAQASVIATRALVARLEPLAARVAVLSAEESTLRKPINVPDLKDNAQLQALIARLSAGAALARIPAPGALPAAPVLKDTARLGALLSRLAHGLDLARLPAPGATPAVPELSDTAKLARLVSRLSGVGDIARLPVPGNLPALPNVQDTRALADLLTRLQRGAQLTALAKHVPSAPAAPEVALAVVLARDLGRLAQQAEALVKLAADEKALAAEEQEAKDANHALMDQLGVCPVCNTPFAEAHHA